VCSRTFYSKLCQQTGKVLIIFSPSASHFSDGTSDDGTVASQSTCGQRLDLEQVCEELCYDRCRGIERIMSVVVTPGTVDPPPTVIDSLSGIPVSFCDSLRHFC